MPRVARKAQDDELVVAYTCFSGTTADGTEHTIRRGAVYQRGDVAPRSWPGFFLPWPCTSHEMGEAERTSWYAAQDRVLAAEGR